MKYIHTCILLFFLNSQAYAIVEGTPDCTDNPTNTGCGHPHVVFISAFNPTTNITVPGTRCTASLLKKDPFYAVFLTASHCTGTWMTAPSNDFGVSFDAAITKDVIDPDTGLVDLNLFTNQQFVLEAIPLINNQYDINNFLINDFGAVILPLDGTGHATAVNGTVIDVSVLPVVQTPQTLDYVVPLVANGNTVPVRDVGYGVGVIRQSGQNGNAFGSISLEIFGNRYVSNNRVLTGLSTPKFVGDNNLRLEQHLNRDEQGVCSGDSGGPTFYIDNNGDEIQIGIHSGAGSLKCNTLSFDKRTDVPEVKDFIDCLVDSTSIDSAKLCGKTSLQAVPLNIKHPHRPPGD